MSQLSRPKTNPTPVAPAPTNMHPSQHPPTHPNGKPKQRRYRATPEQLTHLISRFEINPSPTSADLHILATSINMPPQSAVLWFKNRRARVPHKKTDKPLHPTKRPVSVETRLPTSPNSNRIHKKPHLPVSKPTIVRIPSLSPEAAAAESMAQLAMAVASVPPTSKPHRKTTSIAHTHLDTPIASTTPSRTSPVFRKSASEVVPFDIGLVTRLGNSAANGAEFVPTPNTPRRPRAIPRTPRLLAQREYAVGENVEVLETSKGICRTWYSATVVARGGPRELSLGQSAAAFVERLAGSRTGAGGIKDISRGENSVDDEAQSDGGDSPRTVRSPAASPTPLVAKVKYTVKYEHRFECENGVPSGTELEEEVLASRIRPAPPIKAGEGDWRPEAGEAVEVLRDGAWFVAVIQTFVIRKGYMVSFESGDVQWVRRHVLRPYQIWRGGVSWVTKTKPPLPVVRKSVGLRVTHPPGGKRKRNCGDGGSGGNGRDSRETRGKSKRSRSLAVEGSGPDGLPEGWRMDYMTRSGFSAGSKGQTFYIAPDGNRLRCLKEAQRYVKMMGPA